MNLILLAIACATTPSDSAEETDVEVSPKPVIDMRDRWWVPEGQRLPNQGESWCTDLNLLRFPDYEGCFGEVLTCRQGLWLEPDADAWRIYELTALSCDGSGAEERHDPFNGYGQWVFLDNTDAGDLYRVNAMEWEVEEEGDDVLRVTHLDLEFQLVREGSEAGAE